ARSNSGETNNTNQLVKFFFRDITQDYDNNNSNTATLLQRFLRSDVDRPIETKTTVVKTTPLSSSSQFNIAENRPVAKYPIKILDLDNEPVSTTTQLYVVNERQTFKTDSIAIKGTASLPATGRTLQIHEHSNAEKAIPVKADTIQLHQILGTDKTRVIEMMPPEPPPIQLPNQPVQPPEHIASTETTIPPPPSQNHSTSENADVPVLEPNKQSTASNEPDDSQEFRDQNLSSNTQDDNASSDDTLDYNNKIAQQQEDLRAQR
ncbi:hypothetical protein RFI_29604, partial [Reticulomyxa filosa]